MSERQQEAAAASAQYGGTGEQAGACTAAACKDPTCTRRALRSCLYVGAYL